MNLCQTQHILMRVIYQWEPKRLAIYFILFVFNLLATSVVAFLCSPHFFAHTRITPDHISSDPATSGCRCWHLPFPLSIYRRRSRSHHHMNPATPTRTPGSNPSSPPTMQRKLKSKLCVFFCIFFPLGLMAALFVSTCEGTGPDYFPQSSTCNSSTQPHTSQPILHTFSPLS